MKPDPGARYLQENGSALEFAAPELRGDPEVRVLGLSSLSGFWGLRVQGFRAWDVGAEEHRISR